VTELVHRYEDIAAEYYDAIRHPTSANFRQASALVLAEVLPGRVGPDSNVAEVGCGDSLLMEVLADRGLEVGRATLTDSSPTMLSYSEHWRGPGVHLVLADAEHLPFADESQDLVVSVLGDPYNTEPFWQELGRTLAVGGHAVYTTPSFEWSRGFRGEAEQAVFDRRDDEDMAVSSIVLPPDEQEARIERAGLALRQRIDVPLRSITGQISPKLGVLRNPDAAVVTGYVAEKVGERRR
jgi:SAM-dependent methyltransferase